MPVCVNVQSKAKIKNDRIVLQLQKMELSVSLKGANFVEIRVKRELY